MEAIEVNRLQTLFSSLSMSSRAKWILALCLVLLLMECSLMRFVQFFSDLTSAVLRTKSTVTHTMNKLAHSGPFNSTGLNVSNSCLVRNAN